MAETPEDDRKTNDVESERALLESSQNNNINENSRPTSLKSPDDNNFSSQPLDAIVTEDSPTLDKWWESCYRTPLLLVYVSHALSSWGDRMWAFTMGMLLIDWENLQSLRTVAIHQLCQAGAVFIFGALIGTWVDRARRLRATVSSIVAQNVFVCLSALVLLVLLKTTENRDKNEPAFWQHHFAVAIAIAFSTLAYLASVACQLTVVKDWVPALCNENRTKLTKTNAILKRIDLTTAILSPLLAGAAMEAAGAWAGGIVVVCWNVLSAPCEIALLYLVYYKNPQLQVTKTPRHSIASMSSNGAIAGSAKHLTGSNACCTTVPIMRPAITLFRGWSTYWHQVVRYSGASLSALYFTVLSFDAVTTAYVRSLCVSELVVAGVRIGSFVLGLVGTVVFPHIRKRFGLRLGGAIFYVSHAIILGIAVISVFLPGSPFGPVNKSITINQAVQLPSSNETTNSTTMLPVLTTISENSSNQTSVNVVTEPILNGDCVKGDNVGGFRFPHLVVMTVAVILSRLTLWGTDLSINQALVERVSANERGVVNGVQGSLNQLVDLLRLTAVILVPYPTQFGYLVMATFAWIIGGAILYIIGSPADDFDSKNDNNNAADYQMDRLARKA